MSLQGRMASGRQDSSELGGSRLALLGLSQPHCTRPAKPCPHTSPICSMGMVFLIAPLYPGAVRTTWEHMPDPLANSFTLPASASSAVEEMS